MQQENPEQKGYRFLEHVTDAFIEAWAPTMEEAFAQAGRAFYDTMLHIDKVRALQVEQIQVQGHDLKELLYNWLEQLLIQFDVESMVYSSFHIPHIIQNRSENTLTATIEGERYDPKKHGAKVEVKGITYHLMEIETSHNKTRLQFLLDL